MPHVDDGMLHAYLDGALDALYDAGALPDALTPADVVTHLNTCPDCRARLDIERGTRDNAAGVLRAATGPAVSVPPFAELDHVVRAERRTRRWMPYAWAASLMVAVGAGWWGSQLARDTVVPRSESAAQQSADRVEEMPAAPDRAFADQSAPAAAEAAPAVQQSAQIGSGAAGRLSGAQKSAESRTREAAAPAEAAADAAANPRGAVAGATNPVDSIRRVAPALSELVVPGRVDPIVTQSTAQRQEERRASSPTVPAPPPPPARSLTAPAAAQALSLRMQDSNAFASMALRLARDSTIPWRALRADERRNVRAVALEAGNNPVIDVKSAPNGGALIRVRQSVRNGVLAEVLQWTETAQLASVADIQAQRREAAPGVLTGVVMEESSMDGMPHVVVFVQAIGQFIAIRSTAAELRTLAERLVIAR